MKTSTMRGLERIAHRGFSALAPENSLAAFALALEHGAHSVEFDVQLSADQVPVVFHDATLERLAGTRAIVSQTSLEELQRWDIGAGFSPQFIGETIPTLTSVLNLLNTIPQYLYFDVKPHCHWSTTAIDSLLQSISDQNLNSKSIITAFDLKFLQQVRQASSNIAIGCLVAHDSDYLTALKQAQHLNSVIISAQYQIFLNNPTYVKLTRDQGIDVVTWTVDHPEDWQQLIDLGVTRIVTNRLIGEGKGAGEIHPIPFPKTDPQNS